MKRALIIGIMIWLLLLIGLGSYRDILSKDSKLPALVKNVIQTTVFVEYPGYWSGSGVVVDDNKILTARHIITDAYELKITTWDGKIHYAKTWYVDPDNDCGVIIIDGEFEDIAKLADSNEVKVGDIVFCIGSPYGKGLFNTVSLGIISGIGRSIPYFSIKSVLTSDAPINPGNSGGPVFTMSGEVAGIVAGSRHGAEGLTVIIPSNTCSDLF